jgi:Transcriptional Coactivator p15 (PC4)
VAYQKLLYTIEDNDSIVVTDVNIYLLPKITLLLALPNKMQLLSGKKFVSVQDFKGKKLVQIREYFEKDGKQLPSKKGIALSLQDFKKLIELSPGLIKEMAGGVGNGASDAQNVVKDDA